MFIKTFLQNKFPRVMKVDHSSALTRQGCFTVQDIFISFFWHQKFLLQKAGTSTKILHFQPLSWPPATRGHSAVRMTYCFSTCQGPAVSIPQSRDVLEGAATELGFMQVSIGQVCVVTYSSFSQLPDVHVSHRTGPETRES